MAMTTGLARRIIPCLDVRDGRVVKGVRFSGLRDAGDPVERALDYQAQGADEIVVLDVSATVRGRAHAVEVIAAIRAGLMLPLTAGGGVGCADDAARLLEAGADKVAVNTAAVTRPALIDELAVRFGSQCALVAIDARRAVSRPAAWDVIVRAGRHETERSAIAWAREVESRGAGEILLTSWDRDGTGEGYDLELLSAVTDAVDIPVIASGGARHPEHLAAAFSAGADAVLAASIFHDRELTVRQLKDVLAAGSRFVFRPDEGLDDLDELTPSTPGRSAAIAGAGADRR